MEQYFLLSEQNYYFISVKKVEKKWKLREAYYNQGNEATYDTATEEGSIWLHF